MVTALKNFIYGKRTDECRLAGEHKEAMAVSTTGRELHVLLRDKNKRNKTGSEFHFKHCYNGYKKFTKESSKNDLRNQLYRQPAKDADMTH